MEYNYGNTPDNNEQDAPQQDAPQQGAPQQDAPQQGAPQQDAQQPNYQQQYQDNYNYNVGSNTEYHQTYDQMDTTPMSMGDWVLTILALMIPCAGIVLYFVWAFGKNGNINRRNYCRAYLIVSGVLLAIYMVLIMIFGIAAIGANF